MRHVALVEHAIDPTALLRMVTAPATGATTLFIGTVRESNDGRAVTGIDYSAYDAMAVAEMQRIVDEAAAAFPGIRTALVHRIGTLALEEASVAIAVAHARRAPAMDASRFIIEALKQRVPIWKREHYVEGDWHWIDPTAHAVRAESA